MLLDHSSHCARFSMLPAQQRGATLIVSLIILLIMTVMATSNMQATHLQTKMANNNQARQKALFAAEVALYQIEKQLVAQGHDLSTLQGCSPLDAACYEAQCAGGLCFTGSYSTGDAVTACQLDAATPAAAPVWLDESLDVWQDTSRHATVSLSNTNVPDPKYIVEFLCYVDKSPVFDCSPGNESDCAAFFRVTALATNEDQAASVMLQSTFRLAYQ